ncbi:capping complex subunit for YIEGIA [Desulfofundulus sp.]|uniref:capping complex subunit for YIEGIA n=1 Tax=Desulfofundulus sp. TaxID=2282750 RepID=UPI003C775EB7
MVNRILAVVTLNMDIVAGGAPIFFARNQEEQEKMARYLARTLDAMVHDLENGVYVIVKH